MQEALDESGAVLFKPEEYLDATQIKHMFYSFAHSEKRKSRTIKEKGENSVVEKPQCGICGSIFKGKKSLSDHIAIVHEG